MPVASFLISACALIFTVGSFWWLQARRGRLSCYPPRAFAGYLTPERSALRVPLSIFNTGAVPIVVTALRLRVVASRRVDDLIMPVMTFRRTLHPGPEDEEDFAHPYAISGRSVVSRHVEFTTHERPEALLTGGPVTATVEALLDHDASWAGLCAFPLHVEVMAHPSNYIAYGNDPVTWRPGLVHEALAEANRLRKQMGLPNL